MAHKIAARAPVAVAESFPYLNALQPGVFDPEDIARALVAQKAGRPAEFAGLPAIKPALG